MDVFCFRNSANKFQKLLHSLQNLHVAHLFRDWDFGDGDLRHYKKQYQEVKLEMKLMIGLNMVENLLMLVPLLYTGEFVLIWKEFDKFNISICCRISGTGQTPHHHKFPQVPVPR